MKTCPRCTLEKDLSEFAKNAHRKDGKQIYCRLCVKVINAEHFSKTKRDPKRLENRQRQIDRGYKYVLEHLLKNPCVDCGEADPEVLQFDHVEMVGGSGKRVTDLVQCTIERIQAEIDKCEVRCCNCHMRRTRRQMGWTKRLTV